MTSGSKYDAGIIGAGAWGTTLANHLGLKGSKVLLWAFEDYVVDEINGAHKNTPFLEGFDLSENISATTSLGDFRNVPRLIIVVPSEFYGKTVENLREHVSGEVLILSATKGFVGPGLQRPSERLRVVFPENKIGVLSGPNLAREIAGGLPAISRVASENSGLISEFQPFLSTERFRIYGGMDVIGTELGGALKNIIALAAGMVDELKLGENTLAALITRGLAGMIKFAAILGADERTLFGVSGLGDLVCTCQSRLSRNHTVGRRLARGESIEEILKSMKAVAEGINTTRQVFDYAKLHGLDLPITSAVHGVIFEKTDPQEALRQLMTRTLKME
ncbi:MAG: NAD(P)H-dependent glycerol-3-phosphate dehydrogenase [bacterium]